MATKTTAEKTREQVSEGFGTVVEQLRTPFLAALGAGDIASQAVTDLFGKARAQVDRNVARPVTPADVTELREKLDAADLDKLVDPKELRKLVDPAELRVLVDAYSKAAGDLYRYFAGQGESALDKLREQPQLRKAFDQFDDAVNQAQTRVGDVAGDARELADEVLSRITFRARSTGEKVANATEKAAATAANAIAESADDAADAVTEAGAKAASETRSAARRTAAKTDPKRNNSTVRKTTDNK